MTNKNTRTCRYKYCKHKIKEIDLTNDEYVQNSNFYYHKDCYNAKCKGEWKDKKTKADLQLIKEWWVQNIDKTVVYTKLFDVLNEYLDRGVDSDYLVFVLQYVIQKKMNLRYPAGLKYYVDMDEIKEAYRQKKIKQLGINKHSFVATDDDSAPTFTVQKRKKGFQSILDE